MRITENENGFSPSERQFLLYRYLLEHTNSEKVATPAGRALAYLLERALAAAETAALVGHDGKDLLAGEVQPLELRQHCHGEGAPPTGAAHKDVVVGADVVQIALQLRAGLGAQLRLRLLGTGHVVFGILLHGLDLEEVAADGLLNEFRHDLGVALFQLADRAVPVVLSLAGVVDDEILCHGSFLRSLVVDSIV